MASLGDEVYISQGDSSNYVESVQFGVRSMNGSDFPTINDSRDNFRGEIDESRFVDLMNALQKLARLRAVATSSSVYARQKKREASIKRQNVWASDGKFMEEIQRLVAHGKLKEFEGLQRLAEGCQIARDGLGPVEQEAIETEQEWEGHTWILRQAEEEFDFEFQFEFEVADSYPPLPISVSSSAVSDVENNKEDGAETVPPFSSSLFPSGSGELTTVEPNIDSSYTQLDYFHNGFTIGLEQQNYPAGSQIPDSDSGFGDIDDKITSSDFGEAVHVPSNAWRTHSNSNEFYPHLLANFESSRDRINKWLENTILQSHLEGTTLFNILTRKMESEMKKVPSNWAQLVMAYWEIDGATIPYKRGAGTHAKDSPKPSQKPRTPPANNVQAILSLIRPESPKHFEENHDVENTLVPSLRKISNSVNGNHFRQTSGESFAINLRARST